MDDERVNPLPSEGEANETVERALYMKAVGFDQREEKTIYEDDGKGGAKEKREVTVKRAPPDLPAIMTWLQGRMPDKWNAQAEKADPVVRVVSEAPRPPKA